MEQAGHLADPAGVLDAASPTSPTLFLKACFCFLASSASRFFERGSGWGRATVEGLLLCAPGAFGRGSWLALGCCRQAAGGEDHVPAEAAESAILVHAVEDDEHPVQQEPKAEAAHGEKLQGSQDEIPHQAVVQATEAQTQEDHEDQHHLALASALFKKGGENHRKEGRDKKREETAIQKKEARLGARARTRPGAPARRSRLWRAPEPPKSGCGPRPCGSLGSSRSGGRCLRSGPPGSASKVSDPASCSRKAPAS